MNGYINKQNCPIWDEVHQVAMHSQKVAVWCGFWAGGVFGPYFFENDVTEVIPSTASATDQ